MQRVLGKRRSYLDEAGSCPPLVSKRTKLRHPAMSVSCHLQTHALQQSVSLFQHLVGTGEQQGRHGETQRLRCYRIYNEPELGRLFNRKISGALPAQNAATAAAAPPVPHSCRWRLGPASSTIQRLIDLHQKTFDFPALVRALGLPPTVRDAAAFERGAWLGSSSEGLGFSRPPPIARRWDARAKRGLIPQYEKVPDAVAIHCP